MPENKPIPDAELAEVKRSHALLGAERIERDYDGTGWIRPDGDAELGNWRIARFAWANESDAVLAVFNAFPGLIARLEAAERERGNLEAELEEARDDSAEYEKDCKKALCSLAREFDYEWDGDGATADDLREFISETMRNALEHAVSMQNDRDGAVYAMIVNGLSIDSKALAARDAKQRREGAAEELTEIANDRFTGGLFLPDRTHYTMPEVREILLEAAQRLREGGE